MVDEGLLRLVLLGVSSSQASFSLSYLKHADVTTSLLRQRQAAVLLANAIAVCTSTEEVRPVETFGEENRWFQQGMRRTASGGWFLPIWVYRNQGSIPDRL